VYRILTIDGGLLTIITKQPPSPPETNSLSYIEMHSIADVRALLNTHRLGSQLSYWPDTWLISILDARTLHGSLWYETST
jgi:hypothetical protein